MYLQINIDTEDVESAQAAKAEAKQRATAGAYEEGRLICLSDESRPKTVWYGTRAMHLGKTKLTCNRSDLACFSLPYISRGYQCFMYMHRVIPIAAQEQHGIQ